MLTSEILKKLAPKTPAATRDRFLPYLNEACPRYGITTELRLAAFLATVCFESGGFRYTAEIRIRNPKNPRQAAIKRMQDKYWYTGFFGQGLIQLTHKSNVEAFDDHISNNPGPHSVTPNFVMHPEELQKPVWAVESACWYWKEHNLNDLADKGKFRQIQKAVNRGNPNSKLDAIDYPDRLKLYDIALDALPDNFSLDGAAPSPDPATAVTLLETDNSKTSEPAAPSFFDRVRELVKKARETIVEMGIDPNRISFSSWFTTITTQASGYALKFWGLVTGNFIYILIGLALVGIGVWYFRGSKERVHANKLAALKS